MGLALTSVFLSLFLILSTLGFGGIAAHNIATTGLRVGFYSHSCPNAESIIRGVVERFFYRDKTVPAALLRLFFHDCFVRGCDASLLLNSTSTNRAEKDAVPNASVRGYDLIEAAKTEVEKHCKGKVSCADVIALATRDSVVLAGGPNYAVPTGRRDGRISNMTEANTLPDPGSNAAGALAAFATKGLSAQDLVLLLGAHTVGITHCNFIRHRIYNFRGTGAPDPSMEPALVTQLQRTCAPNSSSDSVQVFLDQGTPFVVDKVYFNQLVGNRAVLIIDQQLRVERRTDDIVQALAKGTMSFNPAFTASLIKMGNIGVITGSQGEIRKKCSVVN